ncbi:hypothetical protein C8Q74DRAFT_1366190 [Fomes fomentarius]|nr:hypothetical protein C8Q74DRAFT_1366190 [Fomes fomentarius]
MSLTATPYCFHHRLIRTKELSFTPASRIITPTLLSSAATLAMSSQGGAKPSSGPPGDHTENASSTLFSTPSSVPVTSSSSTGWVLHSFFSRDRHIATRPDGNMIGHSEPAVDERFAVVGHDDDDELDDPVSDCEDVHEGNVYSEVELGVKGAVESMDDHRGVGRIKCPEDSYHPDSLQRPHITSFSDTTTTNRHSNVILTSGSSTIYTAHSISTPDEERPSGVSPNVIWIFTCILTPSFFNIFLVLSGGSLLNVVSAKHLPIWRMTLIAIPIAILLGVICASGAAFRLRQLNKAKSSSFSGHKEHVTTESKRAAFWFLLEEPVGKWIWHSCLLAGMIALPIALAAFGRAVLGVRATDGIVVVVTGLEPFQMSTFLLRRVWELVSRSRRCRVMWTCPPGSRG